MQPPADGSSLTRFMFSLDFFRGNPYLTTVYDELAQPKYFSTTAVESGRGEKTRNQIHH